MADMAWAEKTCVSAVALALPVSGLLWNVYWNRFRRRRSRPRMPLAFWSACTVVLCFSLSIPNIIISLSVGYMIGWPLIGIALSFLGLVLIGKTESSERWKLALANILALILSVASVVAPN